MLHLRGVIEYAFGSDIGLTATHTQIQAYRILRLNISQEISRIYCLYVKDSHYLLVLFVLYLKSQLAASIDAQHW